MNCPVCIAQLQQDESKQVCPECHAHYHKECWEEVGGCAMYGCAAASPACPRDVLEYPVSFWGQENKECPNCGKLIRAAAVRCRFCGATFESAQPENSQRFAIRRAQEERSPKLKRAIWVGFALSIVPFTAPFAAAYGAFWYSRNQSDLASLPGLYGALVRIGLVMAVAEALIGITMLVIFAVKGHQ